MEESEKDKIIRNMESIINELKDQLNEKTILLERERSENIHLSRMNSELERKLEIVTKDLYTLESEKKDLMKKVDDLQAQLDTARRFVPKQDHVGARKRKREKTTSKRKKTKQSKISADEPANYYETEDDLGLIKTLIDSIVNSTKIVLARSGTMIDAFSPIGELINNNELKEEVNLILERMDELFPKFVPIDLYDDTSISCLISFSEEIMQMFKKFSDVTKLILETIEETPPVIVFKKELKRTSIADEELKSALKNFDELNPKAKTRVIDDVQAEKKKKATTIQTKIPACFENCQPQIMEDSYLHLINMELMEPIPVQDNPYNRPIKNPGDFPQTFGILSSKKLPQINSFPIFTKIGKIKIDVALCETTINLTDEEMAVLKEFHEFLFSNVLNVGKSFEFDPLCRTMNFYIVPVHSDLEPSYIDWKFIEKIYASDFKEVLKNMQKSSINSDVYEDSVLIKPYKMSINKTLPTYHHVIKLTDKTPESLIDFQSFSQTVEQYYKNKYKISIKDKKQTLWETYSDGISVSSKPLQNTKLYNSKLFKNGEKIKMYKEYLVPEICYCCPFKSIFLLKSLYLPTIIYRVTTLLLAEELKDKVEETSMERFAEKRYNFFDITKKEDTKMENFNDIAKKNVNTFLEKENNSGPSPGDILTGLTLKAACDVFDLERSEFLGDSYLKFLTTFQIYMCHPDYSNDQMNTLRTKIVNNENLFNKACEKNINRYLITKPFQELGAWIPPCFKASELEKNKNMEVSSTTLSHKKIADAVEALIGVYLTSCGPKGAEMFMKWAGLTLEERITENKLQNFGFILTENEVVNLEEINVVEDKIKYSFKNKTLIQIALTPYKNDNTYEKLFIIGNCVLDLLVSCYFYEDGQQFEPAELTKARSLILRKINLACIALTQRFHEQMINVPQIVKQGISEMEKSSCFKFFKELGCAVNDIHFPKNRTIQLQSEVVQAIAAAVLLDNNMNWNAVWKIYFPILEQSLKYVIKTIRKKKTMQ